MLTTDEARKVAKEKGIAVAKSTITSAARSGDIPGATKFGRDWQLPENAFLRWINNRRPLGRPSKQTSRPKRR